MTKTRKAVLVIVAGITILKWLGNSAFLADDVTPYTRKLVPTLAQKHPAEAVTLIGKGLTATHASILRLFL